MFSKLFARKQTLVISIVIPVYNAMPFLKSCVESIFAQGADDALFEVILVDDGSDDGSGSFCDKVARKHGNVRAFHQKNSGSASKPRNVGLSKAQGDYVFFCDSDDGFYPDALSTMIERARELRFDIGIFKMDRTDWVKEDPLWAGKIPEGHCDFENSAISSFYSPCFLVRRALLVDNDITFPEGPVPEDWPFVAECYLRSKDTRMFGDRYYYKYRKRDDGQSITLRAGSNFAAWWERYRSAYQMYMDIAGSLCDIDAYPAITAEVTRPFRTYVGRVDEEILPASALADMRAILGSHYTEQVRARLPFARLMVMDALVAGEGERTISQAIAAGKDPRCLAISRDAEGRPSYSVLDEGGSALFSRAIPQCDGSPLRNSENWHALSSVRINADMIEFKGAVFLVLAKGERYRSISLILKCFKVPGIATFPVRIVEQTEAVAFGHVELIAVSWEASVPSYMCKLLAQRDQITRQDFFLDLLFSDDKKRIRLSAPENLGGAHMNEAVVDDGEMAARLHITKLSKLSLHVCPSTMREKLPPLDARDE